MDKRSEAQFPINLASEFPKVNKVILQPTEEAPSSIQDTHLKFRGTQTSPGSGVKVGDPNKQFGLADTSSENMRGISSNITEAAASGETAKYNARLREKKNADTHFINKTKPNVVQINTDPAKGK